VHGLQCIDHVRVSPSIHLGVCFDLFANLLHKFLQQVSESKQSSIFGSLEILVQTQQRNVLLEHPVQVVSLNKGSRKVVTASPLRRRLTLVVMSLWLSMHFINYL
jgi:hypothetical protein